MAGTPEVPGGEADGRWESVLPEFDAGWGRAWDDDVDELPEPGHLGPDPLAGVPLPEEVEPPWLASWLKAEEQGLDPRDDEDEAAPDHLPSEILAGMEPGQFLLTELETTDLRAVDEYHLVEMAAGYQRLAALAYSRMTQVAGHLARRPALNPTGWFLDREYTLNVTAQELAPRLGLSKFAAKRIVDNARLFGSTLEDTGIALEQGHIDYAKACVIARMLSGQPDDVAWEVQQLVLPDAAYQTIAQLERAIAKAIISIDPMRATARHKAAREQRRVHHPRPLPDGMASLFAVLPATDAAGLDLALEAAARTAKAAGDTRTIDQLRADALALLGHGALEHGFIGIPQEQARATDPSAAASANDAPPAPDAEANPSPAESAEEAPGAEAQPGAAESAENAPGAEAQPGAAESAENAPGAEAQPSAAESVVEAPGADAQPSAAESVVDLPAPDDDPDPDQAPMLETGNAFLRTPHMPIGSIGGCKAQVKITVPLSVLLSPGDRDALRHDLGDSSAHDALSGDEPGPDEYGFPQDQYYGPPVEVAELEGYGPVTPDVARALALRGGTWQRLVTDPLSGELLDVGRTRYRPPAAIADFVRTRDGTCACPGCSSPARSCQLDHVVPWQFGGVTSVENVALMCGGDHPTKTVGAFQLRHLGGGTFQWTTPTGHHYLRHRGGRVTPLSREVRTVDRPHGAGTGTDTRSTAPACSQAPPF